MVGWIFQRRRRGVGKTLTKLSSSLTGNLADVRCRRMTDRPRRWSLNWAWTDRIVACLSTRALSGNSGYLTRSIFLILMRLRTWAGSLSYLPFLGSYSSMLQIYWPPCKLEDNLRFMWFLLSTPPLGNHKTSSHWSYTGVNSTDTFPPIYSTSFWSMGKYNQIYWSPHPSLFANSQMANLE